MATATPATFATLEKQAATNWRRMVSQTAKTGRQPDGRELIDAALTLGINVPGEVFHSEVDALVQHTEASARLKRLKSDEAEEVVALEQRTAKLAALEAEVEELKRTMFSRSWSIGSDVGEAEAILTKLEKQHPFLVAKTEEVTR